MIVTVGVLLAGILLLLSIPVDVAFQLTRTKRLGGEFSIRWLFGLLRLRIPIDQDEAKTRSPQQGHVETDDIRADTTGLDKRQQKSKRKGKNPISLLSNARFRDQLFRLIRKLMHAMRVRDLDLRIRLGLGDPADTGCLWALLGPVNAAATQYPHGQIEIEPDFMNATAGFDTQGRIVLIPLSLSFLLIGFVFSPAVLAAWFSLSDD